MNGTMICHQGKHAHVCTRKHKHTNHDHYNRVIYNYSKKRNKSKVHDQGKNDHAHDTNNIHVQCIDQH